MLAVLSMSCGESTLAPSGTEVRRAPANGTPSLDWNSGALFGGLRSTSFTVTSAGGSFAGRRFVFSKFPGELDLRSGREQLRPRHVG